MGGKMDSEFMAYVGFLCNNYTATTLMDTVINTPVLSLSLVAKVQYIKLALITTPSDKRYLLQQSPQRLSQPTGVQPTNKY